MNIWIKIKKQTPKDRSSEGKSIAPRLRGTRQRSDNKAASTRGLFSRKVGLSAVEGSSSVRKTSKQYVCWHVGCWILYGVTVVTQLPCDKYVYDCRSQHSKRQTCCWWSILNLAQYLLIIFNNMWIKTRK